MNETLGTEITNSTNDTEVYDSLKLDDILHGEDYNDGVHLGGKHILVIIMCLLAIFTNATTLTAIRHIRRRLSANQTMMFSLCFADLLTSIGVLARVVQQQVYGIHSSTEDEQMGRALCLYKVVQAFIMTGHNATLLNLLCLAVDHYCAIAKPLTYSLYMSKRRVHITLVVIWCLAVLFGFSDFLILAPVYDYCSHYEYMINYCEKIYCTSYEPDHLMFCVVLLCLEAMTVMYGWIMCILYRYRQQQYTTVPQRKAQRHIRGLVTSFIILGVFAIFWLPNCIFEAYVLLRMTHEKDIAKFTLHKELYWYLYALVLYNAVCDPIIYAMRMREIQESLKRLFRFTRPSVGNRSMGFGDALRHTSSCNIPMSKYVQRQHSNSTNTTVCSNGFVPLSNRSSIQEHNHRKSTLSSQISDITEDTPLQR